MSIVTVDLPQHLFEMRSGTFALRSFKTTAVSNFQPSVPRREGARDQLWSARMDSTIMNRATAIEMEAWFAQLADRDWAFTAHDPLRNFTLGVGAGYAEGNDEILFTDANTVDQHFCSDLYLLEGATTALVKSAASRGSRSILIKNLDTSLEGQIVVKKGDHVGIGLPAEMNLHMVVADAVCDANGEARIVFIAPLWKRALVNDVVNFYKPTARFVMVDENSGELVREPGVFASGSVMAIEYPYQENNP